MAAGRGAIGIWAVLAGLLMLVGQVADASALGQGSVDIKPLGRDEARQIDRYQVTLNAGATLWQVANDYLPLIGLDESNGRAFEFVEESFRREFPDRSPGLVKPGDTFVLEVPVDTFVTERVSREGNSFVFSSFLGSQLTYYPRHPALVYRLVRHTSPNRAEVSLGGVASPVDLAREIYQVDPPDFLQVRMVRAALNDNSARVTVDLSRKYLDDFRNYRERAVKVEDGEHVLKVYLFDPADQDVPFVRVEDAIGDRNDPGEFPREFRLAFYRDGTVRRYVVTEPGDALGQFNRPDAERWQQVLPQVKDWSTGTVEALPPFSPAVNSGGALMPGRLLVLSFAPKMATQPTAAAAGSRLPSGSGLGCLGVPLAVLTGLAGVFLASRGLAVQ